ncbi:MAG TPA: outer membrane beta-barrel protein [Candidatus Methylacidiphilales bacterium]
MKKMRDLRRCFLAGGLFLGVSAAGSIAAHAQDTQADAIAKLQAQNQALQKRLDALEDKMDNGGIDSKEMSTPPSVTAATVTILSGYVQTSYFDNLNHPAGGNSAGYLWNTKSNNFSINKVKLTLASPAVVPNGDKWDAGYRFSLLAGEDAPILNTNSGTNGFQYLREAYVDINIPIGNGLDVKAGDMISLLNYESGDGGAANENFSQGYQWYYTGDGPETGVQLSYDITKWLNVKVRIEDGLFSAVATRDHKGYMGSINVKPSSTSWISLLGFGGEGVGNEDADGGEILAGWQITKKLGTGFEGDYFHLDAETGQSGELWSLGTWVWYDFTPEVGLAFRGEFVGDPDGAGLNVSSLNGSALAPPLRGGTSAISSPDQSGDIASLTLTLNFRPTPNIKIQPEIRYDTTTYAGGFNGKTDQIIAGCGISYLY